MTDKKVKSKNVSLNSICANKFTAQLIEDISKIFKFKDNKIPQDAWDTYARTYLKDVAEVDASEYNPKGADFTKNITPAEAEVYLVKLSEWRESKNILGDTNIFDYRNKFAALIDCLSTQKYNTNLENLFSSFWLSHFNKSDVYRETLTEEYQPKFVLLNKVPPSHLFSYQYFLHQYGMEFFTICNAEDLESTLNDTKFADLARSSTNKNIEEIRNDYCLKLIGQ